MTADTPDATAQEIARRRAVGHAICAERCAFMGEPACWQITDDNDEPLPWPPEACDDPGCEAMAAAAIAAILAAERDGGEVG